MQAACVAPRYPVPITLIRAATCPPSRSALVRPTLAGHQPLSVTRAPLQERWAGLARGLPVSNNGGVTQDQDFDLFTVREEHELLRESVRSLAETKIAPYAAAVDEEARYPQEAHDALHAADMHAIHIPEQY